MAMDIRKLKEEAAEFTRKGKFEDAIKIYKNLVLADKKEVQHAVKLAELYTKLKQNDKAIPWYETAAKKYAEQGHLPKAIAMSKLILQLDPKHAQTQAMLSGLYAKKDEGSPFSQRTPLAPPARPVAVTVPPSARAVDLAPIEGNLEAAPLHGFTGTPAFEEETEPEPIDPPEVEERSFDLQNLEEAETEITIDVSDADLQAEISRVDPRVLEHLPRVPLFSELNTEEFQGIIEHLDVRSYEPNEYIVTEGDPGDSFFVITQGEAIVVKEDYAGLSVELTTLLEGAFFGEFAYLTGSTRTASVVAKNAVEVLELSRAGMDALVQEHPRLEEFLQQFYKDRVLHTILAISPLFEPFSAAEKQHLIRQFKFAQVPADTVLIEQDTDGTGLFIIMHGEVEVLRTGDDGQKNQVATMRAGEFFGEMSLLNNGKTTATVSTTVNSSLFRLPAQEFSELAVIYPALLDILKGFAEERRLRNQALDAGFGESGLV
jgi:CRP-like cAMP-binding protein